jgi:hypothetical protein
MGAKMLADYKTAIAAAQMPPPETVHVSLPNVREH